MRRSLAGKRILLTGASSGIGRALALRLARERVKLLLTARRQELLETLAAEVRALGSEAEVHAGDITDHGTRSSLVELASMRFGGLDLLINNAGVGAYGPFRTAGHDRLRTVLELNFFATVEMTRLSIPLLVTGSEPMIVNVGSILGHRGIPWASEYCASKFAVQGFSEALRAELSADGIDVLVVSPGTTDTDFNTSAVERADMPWGERRGVPASAVADATVRAIRRGKHEIVPNAAGRWLLWLNRLSPRLVDAFMQRYGKKR